MEKAKNQYVGEYFERCVAGILTGDFSFDGLSFPFSQEEKTNIFNDAKLLAKKLDSYKKVLYTGRNTSVESGDLICDNDIVELKYVSGGKGTYLNTSINYLSLNLGFTNFHNYQEKKGYFEFLMPLLEENGFKDYSLTNSSPVSMEISSKIQKLSIYSLIQAKDKQIRKDYVKELYEYLSDNTSLVNKFLSDILSKNCSNKQAPDRLLIFNYSTKEITDYNQNFILSLMNNKKIKNAGLSLVFDDIRVAIGWQNGSGLNNPTLRAFIK